MSNTKTQSLADLIHSMSQSEKRHFKIFAGRHVTGEQNAYLELYENIRKQKNPDDQSLKKQFTKSMSNQQYHVVKHYLYDLLLKSLRNFHEGKNIDSRLHQMLESVAILFDKNLFDQCHEILKKAYELAKTYEKYNFQIAVNQWYHILLRKERNTPVLQEYTSRHHQEQQWLLEKLENRESLMILESEIFCLKEGYSYIRNEQEKAVFDKVMAHPLLERPEKALGFEAKLSYYNTHNIYLRVQGALQESYQSRKKLVELWESYPEQKAVNPLKYLVAIGNLLAVQKELKKYEEGLDLLERMVPLKGQSFQLDKEIFLLEKQFELITFVATGQYQKGLALKPDIDEGVQRFKGYIRDDWLFDYYFDLGMLYAMAGQLNEALDWVLYIEQTFSRDQFSLKMGYAKLFNLMLHTDLGNQFYLESAWRSTYRYLQKRSTLYEFERLVLQFLKKLPVMNDKNQYQKDMHNLLIKLEKLSQQPNERRAMDYLNFRAWIYSKLHNKSFANTVAEFGAITSQA